MKLTSDAVSEVIGAILLISIVSVAIAIIAVALLSSPPPAEVPHASIVAVRNNTTQKVTMVHAGGDDLDREQLLVRLDNGNAQSTISNPDFTMIPSSDRYWSPGESIQINVVPGPSQIQLIYTGGGGNVLIDTITVQSVAPGIGPDIEGNISYCDGIEQLYLGCFIEKLNKNSIYLSRSKPGSHSSISGDLTFTVNNTGSYLVVNEEDVHLNYGDVVRYHFEPSTPNLRIFMVGNFGWTGSVTGVSGKRFFIYQTYAANGTTRSWTTPGLSLDESWIGSYSNMISTLNLVSDGSPTKSYTRLVINGTIRCDQFDGTQYTIYGAEPTIPTLWVIIIPKSTEDNFLYIGKGNGGISPACCSGAGC